MPVQVVCPKCQSPLTVGDEPAGQVTRCTVCGSSIRITRSTDGGAKHSTVGSGASASVSGPAPARGAAPAGKAPRADCPASIGPYPVSRELGRGAFGIVYQARDAKLGRDVAIKVLNRNALASPKAVARFLREARVLGQIHHNNIVPVFQLEEQDGAPYIVSKFIPGKVLSSVIPENGMDPAIAVKLVIQLLEALAFAHEEVQLEDRHVTVLHRDVKPANAILDAGGRLYLMDFGLAGWIGQDTSRMTEDGTVMGTPAYMAPEQAAGDIARVGTTADQYSAGIVLYELLTGHLPFEGMPPYVMLYNIINSPLPPPSEWRADLDPRLEQICLTALAKEPENRYPSCRQFAQELRAWLNVNEPLGAQPAPEGETRRRQPDPATQTPAAPGKSTVTHRPSDRATAIQPRPGGASEEASAGGGMTRRTWLLITCGVTVAMPVLTAVAYVASQKLAGGDSKRQPPETVRGPGLREIKERSGK